MVLPLSVVLTTLPGSSMACWLLKPSGFLAAGAEGLVRALPMKPLAVL